MAEGATARESPSHGVVFGAAQASRELPSVGSWSSSIPAMGIGYNVTMESMKSETAPSFVPTSGSGKDGSSIVDRRNRQ
jgi:hypothetical protein